MSPHLDADKKIQLDDRGNVDFGSAGAGSILAALRKYKIFETWKTQGIKYVNLVDTDNVTARIADPLALAYLMQ